MYLGENAMCLSSIITLYSYMKLDALRLAFKLVFGFSFIFPAVSFCC